MLRSLLPFGVFSLSTLAFLVAPGCGAGKETGATLGGDAVLGGDTATASESGDDTSPVDTDPGLILDGDPDVATDTLSGERVSSLSLEQIWFLTGSYASKEMLIDFRVKPPVVTCGGVVGSTDGFEGSAVFTDPATGKLLFYTDGRNVFNEIGRASCRERVYVLV